MKTIFVVMMSVLLLPFLAIGGETKCESIPTKRVFRPKNAVKSFFGLLPVVPKTPQEIAAEKEELRKLQKLETERTLAEARKRLEERRLDLQRIETERKQLEWELSSRRKQIGELQATLCPPKKEEPKRRIVASSRKVTPPKCEPSKPKKMVVVKKSEPTKVESLPKCTTEVCEPKTFKWDYEPVAYKWVYCPPELEVAK